MDKEQVDIIELKSFETFFDSASDVILLSVPNLRGDENFFSLYASSEDFFESFTNLLFVLVEVSAINMSVSFLKDSSLDTLLNILSKQESTIADSRDFVTRVEFEGRGFSSSDH